VADGDGAEKTTFSLEYEVGPKEWNSSKEEASIENEHYYTLRQFKEYLTRRYLDLKAENKADILARLKTEAQSFIKGDGMDGVAQKMFDFFHDGLGLPKYNEFVKAFEKHTGLKKGQYRVETMDSSIHFHVNDTVYEMDTYKGKTIELKKIIDARWYGEISVMSSVDIWNDIYTDDGIEKVLFIPVMFKEWEVYWNNEYKDAMESVGKTAHLDSLKEASWRQFQVFMECYESAKNIIKLAYDIDYSCLYPIAVIAMMKIFNSEVCYSEYCELEFEGGGEEWESISSDDDDDDDNYDGGSIFYIRQREIIKK
jgi:hypothetical protein